MRKFTYLVYRQKSRRCPICSLGTLLNPVATHWHVLHHRNLTLPANHLHQTTSIMPPSYFISFIHQFDTLVVESTVIREDNMTQLLTKLLGWTDTMKLKTITSITKLVLQTFCGEACSSYWQRKNWSKIISYMKMVHCRQQMKSWPQMGMHNFQYHKYFILKSNFNSLSFPWIEW